MANSFGTKFQDSNDGEQDIETNQWKLHIKKL